ncbi:Fe-S protein assembly chaperone HscA [Acidipila sp. EB88]|uniref:Fe-S protein assembly chaperone HscA n=1 Tax=Acidipila sp. EB88 TaxID=2305226 RepID=UPI000F5DBE37|nr:Fe-S protein assembly chaperone HscA [Acidipila sp. EB88]RRA47841.1 Fe-S protein assembly chaperone HscA [Acidipila sp. EB88]
MEDRSLVQIGNSTDSANAPAERVVGIDLGTTNSLVAFMQGGQPVVIPGEDGTNLVPSVVAFPAGGDKRVVVGYPAHRYLAESADRVVYSAKRLMGRGLEDVQEELKLFPFRLARDLQPGEALRLDIGGQQYTPPEIGAQVLRQLKRNAERYFGVAVTKAVVTVPAYFNDAQRQATKDAGRMAGLDVLRLVNEPTAAALAYGLDRQKTGMVAVYDFGGGTFDISILRLDDGIFEVVATGGDTHLGGDDIDNLLLAIALDDIAGSTGLDPRSNGELVQVVRKAVTDAKIALSSEPATRIVVELPGQEPYARELTREQFEQLIRPTIERTLAPVRAALADAQLTPEQIDEVVMVGGSTRIPLVQHLVGELFRLEARGRKLHTELNPDEVVALGAAVQADILAGGSAATADMLLLDVTPLSLGIEALGGVVAKIIHRNSTIPASETEHFTTGVDGQTNVAVHVVQGERELSKDCRSLARFDLKGIPPMSAGLPRIEVRFLIDANGILHVSAREQRSGKEAEIEVKPTYGLTDEQVETMILDSFDNAEADFEQRQLIEARVEADDILAKVEKAKTHPTWKLLSFEEQSEINSLADELHIFKEGDDRVAIRGSIDALDKATHRLAELMMDGAVTSALGGETMASAGEKLGQGPTAPHPFAKAEIK